MGTRPQKDALEEMLEQASVSTLSALVKRLTITHVDLVAECCEFLLEHADLSAKQRSDLASEQVASIWNELNVHIHELNEYGGGEDSTYENVWELTQQLVETVNNNDVESGLRQYIVTEALSYIESDNAGVSKELYDIVLACSISVEEKISLAKFFESLPRSSYISRALSIYRELEYVENYLRLRQSSLCYGADYLDLATFYNERGDKQKGLVVAERGLIVGEGDLKTLRQFVADHAKNAGHRERYMALQFDQAIDQLSLASYLAFQEECTASEWAIYEMKLMAALPKAWIKQQIDIHLHRREYDDALGLLLAMKPHHIGWETSYERRFAKQLENLYPKLILDYYMRALGKVEKSTRKTYAQQSRVVHDIYGLLLNVLNDRDGWSLFASNIRDSISGLPAFQDELSKAMLGSINLSHPNR